jgi:hypothetical protein
MGLDTVALARTCRPYETDLHQSCASAEISAGGTYSALDDTRGIICEMVRLQWFVGVGAAMVAAGSGIGILFVFNAESRHPRA